MKRVLFITTRLAVPWRGSCHRVRHTLEALLDSGYAVDLLYVKGEEKVVHPGIRLHPVKPPPLFKEYPEGPCFRRFVLGLVMFFKALAFSSAGKFDIIHGVDDSGAVAGWVARLRRLPFVVDRQTDFACERRPSSRFWAKFHRIFELGALKRAEVVMDNSPVVVRLLSTINRRARACVIADIPAIPDTLPEGALDAARSKHNPSSAPLVVCVGSSDKFQGLDIFFNAMPVVLSRNPLVRFLVIGGDDAEISRLSAALENAGIREACFFTGRISPSELAAILRIADVLVSPRRGGSTVPVKVLDYLAAARPIVAAGTPANRVLLSSENALVTKPDAVALGEGILQILSSPMLAKSLAESCPETLRREHRTSCAFRDDIRRCYDYAFSQWHKEHS